MTIRQRTITRPHLRARAPAVLRGVVPVRQHAHVPMKPIHWVTHAPSYLHICISQVTVMYLFTRRPHFPWCSACCGQTDEN